MVMIILGLAGVFLVNYLDEAGKEGEPINIKVAK